MSERTYGLYTKTAENKTRCVEAIHGGDRWPRHNQCHFKRGYGPMGEYCKIHDPAAVADRRAKRDAEYKLRWDNSPTMQLHRAVAKIEQLEKEIQRLKRAR